MSAHYEWMNKSMNGRDNISLTAVSSPVDDNFINETGVAKLLNISVQSHKPIYIG